MAEKITISNETNVNETPMTDEIPSEEILTWDICKYLSEVYHKLENRKEFSTLIDIFQNLLNYYRNLEYHPTFNDYISRLEGVKIEMDKGEDHLKWLLDKKQEEMIQIEILNLLPDDIFGIVIEKLIENINFSERLVYRLVNKRFKGAVDNYSSKKTRLTISGGASRDFDVKELALELRLSPRLKDLFIIGLKTDGDVFNLLISEFGKLEYLHLMDIKGMDLKNFVRLARVASQLEYLEVTGCGLDEDCLNFICFNFENLRRLNIKKSVNVSGYSLRYIKSELTDLDLEIDTGFDVNQTFEGLVTGKCLGLKDLDIIVPDFQEVDWSTLRRLTELETLYIEFRSCEIGSFGSLASLDQLTTLSLTEVYHFMFNPIINHKTIVELTSKLVTLTDLSIEFDGENRLDITDDTVKNILSNCKKLEELKLKNTKISSGSFKHLLEIGHVKRLHIDNAKGINDTDVQHYIIFSEDNKHLTLYNVGYMPPLIGGFIKNKAAGYFKMFSLKLNSTSNWREEELNISSKNFEFEFE